MYSLILGGTLGYFFFFFDKYVKQTQVCNMYGFLMIIM